MSQHRGEYTAQRLISLKRHHPLVHQPSAAMSCKQCGACMARLGGRSEGACDCGAVARGCLACAAGVRVGVLRGRPGRNACDAPPVEAGVGQQLRRVVWRRQRRCVDCVQHLQTPNTWTCRGAPPAPWTRRQRLNQPRRIQRWRWRESCGPVLQVGGVGGRALGPRHGPSRSVADLKTLLQRQGATTMPRTDLRPNDLFNF